MSKDKSTETENEFIQGVFARAYGLGYAGGEQNEWHLNNCWETFKANNLPSTAPQEVHSSNIKPKEVIEGQLEVVLGYYNRIGLDSSITIEQIMDWLQDDLNTLRGDIAMLETDKIINLTNRNA